MVITETIRQAIIAAIEQSGSALSFARSVGVSHTTVAYWLKGRTRKINATIWNNLLPLIGGYLGDTGTGPEPAYRYPALTSSQPKYVLRERPAVPSFYDEPSQDLNSAPLFYFSDLADYDPAFDSLEWLTQERARGQQKFTMTVVPNMFAVEVDAKHAGFFSAGTKVLLQNVAPDDGEVVLVKLREKNRFLFARYGRNAGTVTLTPLQKGVKKLTLSREEFHGVCSWIATVREAVQLF